MLNPNSELTWLLAIGLILAMMLLLLVWVLARINTVLKNQNAAGLAELTRLVQNQVVDQSQNFADSRRELREVSAENRRELQQTLKNFEDTLLKRLHETAALSVQHNSAFATALQNLSDQLMQKQDEFRDKTTRQLDAFAAMLKTDAQGNRQELQTALKGFETAFTANLQHFNSHLHQQFADLEKRQTEAAQQHKISLAEIRTTIDQQLKAIRDDNHLQLNEMRRTVDEKLHETLEKRLGESFKHVSERLEQVHKGLGEMQTLAVGVGDLKKVLANVKTRGILGEYQLGNLLEQILAPDQYALNVVTKPGSREQVEYAVKLPGKGDETTVWLPIDSKFPLESYQTLLAAWDEGNLAAIETAQKALLKTVESFAKDISSKYLSPPDTTDFAIMFLPVESLYGEILRHPELFERLQRNYRITITGPTTLSALLNSLNMGFRTLAVQKRSSEVWKVLAEVKGEFGKYAEQLALVHKQLNTASNTLESLQTTRTKALERKLRGVEVMDTSGDDLRLPDAEDS